MSDASSFYPPRARWNSSLRYRYQRLQLWLEKIECPLSFVEITCSLIIPGFSFRAYRRSVGNIIMLVYWLCVLSFFIWFGYPAGNAMFATILGIHVGGIAFLIKRLSPVFSLKFKLFSIIVFLFCLNLYVYMPLRDWISHYFIPTRMGNEVIVTKRCLPNNLKRGDWIMYELNSGSGYFEGPGAHGTVMVRAGYGFSPVLAMAGDTVKFESIKFWVNDKSFPAEAYMPTNGTFVVAEKNWFVWPTLAIDGHVNAPKEQITQAVQARSLVTETNFVGRACERWFWRKQLQP